VLGIATLGTLGPGIWLLYAEGVSGSSGGLGLTFAIFGSIFGLATVSALRSALQTAAAEGAFRSAEIDVDPVLVKPGESTEVTVDLTPAEPVEIDDVNLRLISWEIQEKPDYQKHGSSKERVHFCDRVIDVAVDAQLEPLTDGEPATFRGEVTIPTDRDLHFGETGPLNWEVRFSADVPEAGRVVRRMEITVDEWAL
jgi:hypothetical protein